MDSDRPVGVVLAGGESRRLGRDKARLEIMLGGGPRSLLWWAVARLAQVCDPVLIATGARALAEAATLHDAFEVPVEAVADGPGAGPLAGLLGAAARLPGRRYLMLACDLPLVPLRVLRILAARTGDWVAPGRAGDVESTCAIYSPSAIACLERRARAGDWALHGLRAEPGLDRRVLGPSELGLDGVSANASAVFGPDEWAAEWSTVFLNLNRVEDLARLALAQARIERDYSEVAAAAAAAAARSSTSSKKSKR